MFYAKINCVALSECAGLAKNFAAISKRLLATKQVDKINKYIIYIFSNKIIVYVYMNSRLSDRLKWDISVRETNII